MNHVVGMQLWQLLGLVVGTSIATSIPTSYFAARRGAANAIRTCSAHHDCAMIADRERSVTTADLEKQLEAMHAAHPEIAAMHKAMAREDSGPVEHTRSTHDKNQDGHK